VFWSNITIMSERFCDLQTDIPYRVVVNKLDISTVEKGFPAYLCNGGKEAASKVGWTLREGHTVPLCPFTDHSTASLKCSRYIILPENDPFAVSPSEESKT
jgi:hypothetical protein